MNALERLRAVLCAPDGEVVIDGTDADRSIVAEALKELDAALSQTAGVVLARGWFHALPEDDYEFHDEASGAGKNCDGCIRATIVAAPAASGGEEYRRGYAQGVADVKARPNYDDSGDTKPASQPPASASVSERARELLATQYKAHSFHRLNAIGDAILAGDLLREGEISCALRALEQALTQQRGEPEAVDRDAWAEALELPQGYTVEEFLPGGWHYAWTLADGERMVSGTTWNHPALAAIAAWQYAPATTPQPGAEALRERGDE